MGMDPDIEKAREWLELAAESEDSMEAKALLGRILLMNNKDNEEEEALNILNEVIKRSDEDSEDKLAKAHALRTLGAYYMYQRHDPKAAFPLLEKSALLDDDEAKFDLALLRLFGLGGVCKHGFSLSPPSHTHTSLHTFRYINRLNVQ